MSLIIKSLKVKIYLWESDVGHIAIQIGTRPHVSFEPDKTKPGKRIMDKNNKPASRTNVPGIKPGLVLPVIQYQGKLSSFNDDIKRYGNPRNSLIFDIPNKPLSESDLNKPIRANYQLFDTIQGDNSHNNCVDYVRAEIFCYLSDEYMETKYKLLGIHKPKDFFVALKIHGVAEKMGGRNISYL